MTQTLSIKRVGKATPIVYACAIAHQLAAQPHHAATIATQLVATLHQGLTIHREPLCEGVAIYATATALICFEIGDRAIAAWLDLLLANALPVQPLLTTAVSSTVKSERQLMLQSSALFEAQYTHARCCSLLQLAHREALIRLENLKEAPFYWRFNSPTSRFWLTSAETLYLNQPVDRRLLSQLFAAYDHVFDSSRQRQAPLLRSAQAVAQAFQVFHQEHSLRGKAGEEPTSTFARLGLLMATQRVLYLLLKSGLDLHPMTEL